MSLGVGQIAFLTLVRRYVERQRLAYDAMEQLRPDLLIRRHGKWTQEDFAKHFEYAKQFMDVPQGGYWGENNQWKYFFHGGGCWLVHTVTGEPINWDAPDVYRFDKFWLLDYLEWILKQDSDDGAVSVIQTELSAYNGTLRDFTFTLLEQLHDLNLLSEIDRQNKYTLLPP